MFHFLSQNDERSTFFGRDWIPVFMFFWKVKAMFFCDMAEFLDTLFHNLEKEFQGIKERGGQNDLF